MRKFLILLLAILSILSCSNAAEDIVTEEEVPTFPERSQDDVIRILCFTSSWGINTWYYIPFMLKSAGVKFEFYGLYRGAMTFREWGPIFYDGKLDNSLFQLTFKNNGEVCDYKYNTTQGELLSSEIVPGSFDVIITNNGAAASVKEEEWDSATEIMKKIFRTYPKEDGIVVYNSTWSPAIHGFDILDATNGEISNNNVPEVIYNIVDKQDQERFQDVNWENTQRWTKEVGITHIIPNGSLMHIIRNNAITNTGEFISPAWRSDGPQYVEYHEGEDYTFQKDGNTYQTHIYNTDLCVDGVHAACGLPSFALALNTVATVFAPMMHFSVNDITWRPVSIKTRPTSPANEPYQRNFIDEGYIYNTTQFEIPLNEEQLEVIIRAIELAQKNKFNRCSLQ